MNWHLANIEDDCLAIRNIIRAGYTVYILEDRKFCKVLYGNNRYVFYRLTVNSTLYTMSSRELIYSSQVVHYLKYLTTSNTSYSEYLEYLDKTLKIIDQRNKIYDY